MQYNSTTYNSGEYNITAHDLNLAETIVDSDVLTKQFLLLRTESQPSVDALSDESSLAAFLETVNILQRATYGAVYNSVEYNAAMYNRTVDNDEVLLQVTKALFDSIDSTDVITEFTVAHLLSETITETDVILFGPTIALDDFVFLSEFIRVEITNKACNETVRLADWLSIERNPANTEWYD